MVEDLDRRFGHFRISSFLVQHDPEAVVQIFRGSIVTRCEHLFHTGELDYIALHPDFEIVPNGSLANEYEVILTKHPDQSVTHAWRKTNA